MSLPVKDGNAALTSLKTTLEGSDHVTHHIIDNSALTVTASFANPVAVTGAVTTTFPATQTVTASFANPVAVTGAFSVALPEVQTVTASFANPVAVKTKVPTTFTRSLFSSAGGSPQINWNSASPSNISGTFIIAQSSSTRSGLMVANYTDKDLYVAISDGAYSSRNGFNLTAVNTEPTDYTFVIFPSGTYIADQQFVAAKHSGFFVSSSNISVKVTSVESE